MHISFVTFCGISLIRNGINEVCYLRRVRRFGAGQIPGLEINFGVETGKINWIGFALDQESGDGRV
jgi:hypothetical protein